MKKITILRDDITADFVTPPESRGQIVTTDYAATERYILERTRDASDRSESVVAYLWPESGEFEPQNGRPALGERVGAVVIR